DQDPPGPGRLGQLPEGLVQDGDVVGGGVAAGAAGAQDPGQRFVGVVQEAQDGESARGAVSTLPSVRFPGPLTEPAVRLSTQRALRGSCRSGCPGVRDRASIAVTGDPDLLEVEQFGPIDVDRFPSAVVVGQMATE